MMVAIDFNALVGPPTKGEHDEFKPLLLTKVRLDRISRDNEPIVPGYVFSLGRAFDGLQSAGESRPRRGQHVGW
jgi:hypothetical protein